MNGPRVPQQPGRWSQPFGPAMTDAAVRRILATPPFSRIDSKQFPDFLPLRGLVRNDMRIVHYRPGDLVVRRGDYGNSAFFVLDGALRVDVSAAGAGIPDTMLGRSGGHRRSFAESVAALWRRPRWAEVRRAAPEAADGRVGLRQTGDEATRVFLQDIPAVLAQSETVLLEAGEWFGEVAALGRIQRPATVFAEVDANVLEIRWQGLRDLRSRAPEVRAYIDARYRANNLPAHLRATPLFARLDDRRLAAVAAACSFESFGTFDWYGSYHSLQARGAHSLMMDEEAIAAAGDYPNGVLLLRSGFARLTAEMGAGERTRTYLGRGALYGLEEVAANWAGRPHALTGTTGAHGRQTAEHGAGALVVVRGPEAGRRYLLRKGVQVIGRSSKADITIHDQTLSREQCEIAYRFSDGTPAYLLRDFGSANGTWLNGEAVLEVELQPGDAFRMGGVVLRFILVDSSDSGEYASAGHVERPPLLPLRHSLRAVGYVDVIRVPTAAIEEWVLPTLAPDELRVLVTDAETPPGAALVTRQTDEQPLNFVLQGRFMNGTAAMVIDLTRCTHCDDCVRACAATHDNNPRFLRNGARHEDMLVANACMHCIDPVCMIGCPTGAVHHDVNGATVVINDAACIGCGTCANQCPFQNIRMVDVRDTSGRLALDTATGVPTMRATKCDLCRDQPTGPACVHACPHGAMRRMDLTEAGAVQAWQ